MTNAKVKKLSIVDRYLFLVTEREKIRLAKEEGKPKPWTENQILQENRFCNVRRMDDRVSKWLMDNWYWPYKDHKNMLYACVLARHFNLEKTLGAITEVVFADKINLDKIKQIVSKLHEQGTVFNSAYMIRATPNEDKITTVLKVVEATKSVDKAVRIVDLDSMRNTHANLCQIHGLGSFMAGQIVADLRHALSGTWRDKMFWAPIGPGSARGMLRLLGWWPKQTAISEMTWQQNFIDMMKTTVKRLPTAISNRLEAHDIQNTLCEWDKFERTLWGEGRPKSRYPGAA